MFVIFILLWVIAILLIYANPKTPWAWWASSCLFLNGFGGVAVIFNDNIIPLVQSTKELDILYLCLIGRGIADVLQHYVATYAFIGFVLTFTNFLDFPIQNFMKKMVLILLSSPTIIMFVFYPINPLFMPDYKVLSFWVGIYTVVADLILFISILKEKDSTKKYQKVLTGIIVIPSTLTIMWTSYVSVALGYHRVWELNVWIILFQFIVFVILALKYGVLGVKLRVERFNLDDTIDTVINGLSIISHAIKNEASTISLCVDTIRSIDEVSENADKKLHIIKESCKNLAEFTQRINNFRIFDMDLEAYVINVLIEKVINQVTPIIGVKNIKIINKCKDEITLMIDAIHVSEVLKNIVINAIEAIEKEGTITIEADYIEDKMHIMVNDTGVGIPPDAIDKVLTPFYSTKKGKNNFGLGLSYCYKVMKCHNGNLKINSKVNQGTTMSLVFPMERVLNYKGNMSVDL